MGEGSSALSGFLTSVAGSLTTEITSALPIAGPVVATIAGVIVGWKLFKKLTGARTA